MPLLRKTKSVKTVLHIFENSLGALSAVELIERLNEKMNKTTVYRILERLEGEGLIHSFTATDGLRWYAKCDGCTSDSHFDIHPHIQCKICGKVECLDVEVSIPNVKNYKVEKVELFMTGSCKNCADLR